MASVAYVEVADGGSAEAVARRLADLGVLADLPVYDGDEWTAPIGETTDIYVLDDDPAENDGYSVSIQVHSSLGETETEKAASELYEQLARATGWALRRLDVEASTVATRPVSQPSE